MEYSLKDIVNLLQIFIKSLFLKISNARWIDEINPVANKKNKKHSPANLPPIQAYLEKSGLCLQNLIRQKKENRTTT